MLLEAARCSPPRERAQPRPFDGVAERRQRAPGRDDLVLLQQMLDPLHRRDELGSLLERTAEVDVDVRRRRTVHPRDLHVAAERDRADAVLDALAADLHERGREADVEAARAHLDQKRRTEVAELVDEDEQREPEDGDDQGHVTSSLRARRLASASASTRSAISRAAAPPTEASVS